jgi:hypothetical protein
VFSKRFGDAQEQHARRIAAGGSGNIVIGGWFTGTLDFGGYPLVGAGAGDGFTAMLDQNGNHVWSRRFGANGQDALFAVAVDGSGNTAVEGYFQGTADFGGGPLSSAGQNDVFVAKYDSTGTHVWSKHFGHTHPDPWLGDAGFDAAGHLYVTGQVSGTVDFGGGPLQAAGGIDIFLAKLPQ